MFRNLLRTSLSLVILIFSQSVVANEKRIILPTEVKSKLIQALEANEALHASFFSYEGSEVEKNAMKLKASIEAIKNPEISKLLMFSRTKLSEMKATSTRDANNENYHLVSMALIHIMNKYDVGSKYNAYSCPMVKKKWIQNTEKVADVSNPYAPGMANCGSKE